MAKYEMNDETKQKKDAAVDEARIRNLRSKGMGEREATIAGLVNMKRSDTEDGDSVVQTPKGPKYPYSLRFDLEDEDLTKLGFKELPEVNGICKFTVEAKVDRVSSNQNSDGKNHECVGFQITDMSWDGKEAESPEEEASETETDENKETI